MERICNKAIFRLFPGSLYYADLSSDPTYVDMLTVLPSDQTRPPSDSKCTLRAKGLAFG
jgi:hypothetical protein